MEIDKIITKEVTLKKEKNSAPKRVRLEIIYRMGIDDLLEKAARSDVITWQARARKIFDTIKDGDTIKFVSQIPGARAPAKIEDKFIKLSKEEQLLLLEKLNKIVGVTKKK